MNNAVGRWLKVGVLLMVVVALAACQGAAGAPGEPGPPGPPGPAPTTPTPEPTEPPAEQPPATVGTIAAVTVEVGATHMVDVAANFSEPEGEALTYSADSDDTAAATVSVSGSVVSVTGVADGTATITVTATDTDSLSARQTISVTVGAGDVVDDSGDCATLDVGGTCKVTTAAENSVKSGNTNLLTVTKKDGYWEVLAIAKGTTTVEVRNTATNALVEMIDVHINNRAPKRKGTNPGRVQLSAATVATDATFETPDYPDDGKDPLFNDGDGDPIFVNSADEPLYKIVIPGAGDLNLDDYFTDPDGDDVRFSASSSHSDRAIVVGYNMVADGTTEVLVDVLHNTGNVVTFTFSATDNDGTNRMTSDSDNLLLLDVELRPVLSWRYDVDQYRTAQGVDFVSPLDVDYRRSDPTNANSEDARAGWHHLDFTRDGDTGDVGFQFAEDVDATGAAVADLCTAELIDAVTLNTAESCYAITLSNTTTIKLDDLELADGVHTIPFQVLSAGNVTITVTFMYWDAETPQELHEESKDLSLRVNAVDEP